MKPGLPRRGVDVGEAAAAAEGVADVSIAKDAQA